MRFCYFTQRESCANESYKCEACKVPNGFGFFWVQNGNRSYFEQRFIRDSGRANRLTWIDEQIERLQAERREVEALPSKSEYERGKQ